MDNCRCMNVSGERGCGGMMNQGCRQYRTQNCDRARSAAETAAGCRQPQMQGCEKGRSMADAVMEGAGCPGRQGGVMMARNMAGDMPGGGMADCACAVPDRDCHKRDAMEKLGASFPVVMAYVPWQQWGKLYSADCGLMEGTVFEDLNQIFCGVRC